VNAMRPPPAGPRHNAMAEYVNADPSYDAEYLMWLMRPPEPASPWIDTPAIEQQNWQDPPLWRFQLPEPPKQRLLPLRDQW